LLNFSLSLLSRSRCTTCNHLRIKSSVEPAYEESIDCRTLNRIKKKIAISPDKKKSCGHMQNSVSSRRDVAYRETSRITITIGLFFYVCVFLSTARRLSMSFCLPRFPGKPTYELINVPSAPPLPRD